MPQYLLKENKMLSFMYLNKIANVTLAALTYALGLVKGIDADVVFSFIDDDLHTHEICSADSTHEDVDKNLMQISKYSLIKQINVRIDNEVNICFISNGETFTAVFTSPDIEMCATDSDRLKMGLNKISNSKALEIIELLAGNCYISNGIYYVHMLKSA